LFFIFYATAPGQSPAGVLLTPPNLASCKQTPSVSTVIGNRALAAAMPASLPILRPHEIALFYNGFMISDFF